MNPLAFLGFSNPWTAAATIGGTYLASRLGGSGGGDDTDKALRPYLSSLQESSGRVRRQGQEFTEQGSETITPVLNYFKDIFGPNPAAAMAATRSARGRVIDQYDAARKSITQFGPRGGGSAGAFSDLASSEANALNDVLSNAQEQARESASGIGLNLERFGLTAEDLASQDIGTIIRTILGSEELKTARRGQNLNVLSGLGEAIGTIIGSRIFRPPK